jgi:hypothetical protein
VNRFCNFDRCHNPARAKHRLFARLHMALPHFPNLAGTFSSRNVTFVSPHRDVGDGASVISRREHGGEPLSHFPSETTCSRALRWQFVIVQTIPERRHLKAANLTQSPQTIAVCLVRRGRGRK